MSPADKAILKDVLECNSSKENAEDVVNWLASTIEGQQGLSDMMDRDSYMIEESFIDTDTISQTQSQEILKRINTKIRTNTTKRVTWRVAAILLPFIFILGLGIYINNSFNIIGKTTYTELYIPNGEKAHIVFQDGSEAIINSSTKIKFPKMFGLHKREIELEGEAYFKINQNRHRPFIVKTDRSNIKVLGTSFNVSAYKNESLINVTLDEGAIEFNTSNNSCLLSPGQQLTFDKTNNQYSVRQLKNSENNSLWTSNILHFSDTPLSQTIKILERRFNVQFDVKNKQALDYTFTITTEAKSIEAVLSEIEMISPIRFIQKDGKYEITVI